MPPPRSTRDSKVIVCESERACVRTSRRRDTLVITYIRLAFLRSPADLGSAIRVELSISLGATIFIILVATHVCSCRSTSRAFSACQLKVGAISSSMRLASRAARLFFNFSLAESYPMTKARNIFLDTRARRIRSSGIEEEFSSTFLLSRGELVIARWHKHAARLFSERESARV